MSKPLTFNLRPQWKKQTARWPSVESVPQIVIVAGLNQRCSIQHKCCNQDHILGYVCLDVVTYLPTIMSSHSDARDLKLFHRSMVKMVLALLKMEVREDMRAAIITAIIKPRSPGRENTQRLT